jgi:hypothetical protein
VSLITIELAHVLVITGLSLVITELPAYTVSTPQHKQQTIKKDHVHNTGNKEAATR